MSKQTSWSGNRTAFPTTLRKQILYRDQRCQHCGYAEATIADHIIPYTECIRQGINPHTLDNGQGLCKPCHDTKTQYEIRAGKTRMKPKRTYTHPSDIPAT
ncbi:MAG: HNH endonuclease [Propionibacteriaceae bacterium]|nr:HNH endonuclease [Propionibacteriaceae bacterium]